VMKLIANSWVMMIQLERRWYRPDHECKWTWNVLTGGEEARVPDEEEDPERIRDAGGNLQGGQCQELVAVRSNSTCIQMMLMMRALTRQQGETMILLYWAKDVKIWGIRGTHWVELFSCLLV
jgi:hypothetical protein